MIRKPLNLSRPTAPPKKSVTLTEATEVVRAHFNCVCGGLVTFSVLASIDDPRVPFIAIRCKEHCFLEQTYRIHDITVNRDGSIRFTNLVTPDEKGVLPGFTGK